MRTTVRTPTVKEAARRWMAHDGLHWSFKYQEQIKRRVNGWVALWGEEKEVGNLTVADVEDREAERDDGNRSDSELNQERTSLKRFFTWCTVHGWVQKDLVATWRRRKYEVEREYAPLTVEEEKKFLAVAEESAYREWLPRFVTLAICTGLREGTLQKLTWAMVSADCELEIPGRIMKQRKSLRVPLAPRAVACLGPRKVGPLIPGMPDDGPRVWKVFRAVGAQAGINPASSPHDLRRTFVERMTAAGASLHVVMSLMGSKTIGVLLKHYFERTPDKLAKELLRRI